MAIEALTNDRMREAAQTIHLVSLADRVVGPGTTYVMAPFAYVRPGRFSPAGVRGVYYAGESLDTAIAETTYHRARFLADTNEKPLIDENRVIEATIEGAFIDVAAEPSKSRSALLQPTSYDRSFRFGAEVYAAGHDGVVYPSVRRSAGHCVGVFRPRCVQHARTTMYLGYRWNGYTIDDAFVMQSLTRTAVAESPED